MAKGSKMTECDERQLKAIELLISGESDSETARLVGVNRKTVGEWKKRDYFKMEMDRQMSALKSGIERKILTNVNPMMDKLMKIALNSESDKTSLDALIYCINRICGTPTKIVENNINEDKKDDVKDINSMLKELDETVQ